MGRKGNMSQSFLNLQSQPVHLESALDPCP